MAPIMVYMDGAWVQAPEVDLTAPDLNPGTDAVKTARSAVHAAFNSWDARDSDIEVVAVDRLMSCLRDYRALIKPDDGGCVRWVNLESSRFDFVYWATGVSLCVATVGFVFGILHLIRLIYGG